MDDENLHTSTSSKNRRVSEGQQKIREKPSILRALGKICNEFSRKCTNFTDSTYASSTSEINRPENKPDYAAVLLENLFSEEDVNSGVHNNKPQAKPDLSLRAYDINLIENFKYTNPFTRLVSDAKCFACGRLIKSDDNNLATYGCKGCTTRVYCSPICFGLDWPFHIRFCEAGRADFLMQFFLNRCRSNSKLYVHIHNLMRQGLSDVGRGAVVVIFEQMESLRIFLRRNQDFGLEYYYSIQYMPLSMFKDKFHLLDSFNLVYGLVKYHDPSRSSALIVMVRSSLPSYNDRSLTDLYASGILLSPNSLRQYDHLHPEPIYMYTQEFLQFITQGTKWDIKKRRIVSIWLQNLFIDYRLKTSYNTNKITDTLIAYYLKGELKMGDFKNNPDIDSEVVTSLV